MKHLFFLILAISLFVTTCNKDKDSDSVNLTFENVQGTWKLIEGTQSGKYGFVLLGQSTYTDFVAALSNISVIVTFNTNGSWTSAGTAIGTIVRTEQGEAPKTETKLISGGVGSGTYSVNNGKLTMVGIKIEVAEDEPITFDVKSFMPDSKLEISNYINDNDKDPASGLDVNVEVTTNFKFER